MKSIFANILLLTPFFVNGQTADTASQVRYFDSRLSSYRDSESPGIISFSSLPANEKHFIVRNKVTFASAKVLLHPIETAILDLESRECTAILKRDTVELIRLWSRDFTLDIPLNEVVHGQNPLPYYWSYRRMIENITMLNGNVVYTTGYDVLQPIIPGPNVPEPVERPYFHTWRQINGTWKLTTKTHN